MNLSQKEIESVSKLEPFKRYEYFMKRIAGGEVVYSLKNGEEWAIAEVEDEGEYLKIFSLWSAKEFAELNAIDEWTDYNATAIRLDEFEATIIPLIEEFNYLINVFSIQGNTGFVVSLDEFLRDLQSELDRYQ